LDQPYIDISGRELIKTKGANALQSGTLHMHAGALYKYYLLIQGGVYT